MRFSTRKVIVMMCALILGMTLPHLCRGASEPVAPNSGIPRFEHVFVLVEENENYDDIIGNTADLPYFNSLVRDYGLATNYFADSHPSINDYFFLTAGRREFSTFWASDGWIADMHPGNISGENIASILTDRKRTWKAYLEGLPKPGSLTASHRGYKKRHDPFAYFSAVVRGSRSHSPQRLNLVPFEPSFANDLHNHTFPNYSFIVPDIYDDGHNDLQSHKEAACGDHAALKQIDDWLSKNIRPLVESDDFKRSGLLIIVFDEACDRGAKVDRRFSPTKPSILGGGHVPALIISSKTNPGTTSDRLLHHESILRLCLRALGIRQFPGSAATTPDAPEFFDRP